MRLRTLSDDCRLLFKEVRLTLALLVVGLDLGRLRLEVLKGTETERIRLWGFGLENENRSRIQNNHK